MKNRKIPALLLSLLLLVPCLAATPAAAADEAAILYEEAAPATIAEAREMWPCNSSTGSIGSFTLLDDAQTVRIAQYYNNRSETGSGLPEGETMDIRLPRVSVDTTRWGEVELHFRYARYNGYVDVAAVNDFRVYVSTDSGETWSENYATLRRQELIGFGRREDGAVCEYYDAVSTDLAGLVRKGRTINAVRIKPYEDYFGYQYNTCVAGISILGYADKAPAGEWEPEYIPMDEQTLRMIVVNQAYQIADQRWTADEQVNTDNHGTPLYHYAGREYRGPVYVGTGIDSSWEMFRGAIDENGKYTGGRTSADAIGMQCINFVIACTSRVSATARINSLTGAPKIAPLVGALKRAPGQKNGPAVVLAHTEQQNYEAYAQLKPGDFLVNSGHTRLVSVKPVVVRRADGTIDPDRSGVGLTETAGGTQYYWIDPDGKLSITQKTPDEYAAEHPGSTYLYGTEMRADLVYTFGALYDSGYLGLTLKEYAEGRVQAGHITAKTTATAANVARDGFRAAVQSNYYIGKVTLTLSDRTSGKTIYTSAAYGESENYVFNAEDAGLNAALAALGAGNYRLTLDVTSGPVLTVRGKVPVTRAVQLDFDVK